MGRPAARSARPKPTDSRRRRRPSTVGPHGAWTIAGSGVASIDLAARGDLAEHPGSLLAADVADVLLVLEDDAQCLVDELGLELGGTEREQRRGPIQRL